MEIALLIMSAFAVAEGFAIWALLNRLLIQAKITPITLPERRDDAPVPEPIKPRRVFSMPIDG